MACEFDNALRTNDRERAISSNNPSFHSTIGSGAKPGEIVPSLDNPLARTLFRLIKKNKLIDLIDILENEKDHCPVMKVADIRKYTLLTFCALKNNFTAMKIIYEHARATNELESQFGTTVEDWANM